MSTRAQRRHPNHHEESPWRTWVFLVGDAPLHDEQYLYQMVETWNADLALAAAMRENPGKRLSFVGAFNYDITELKAKLSTDRFKMAVAGA